MDNKKLNLYEKVQAVSNEIKNIEKNINIGAGNYGYKAVSDYDVVVEVNRAETKHRVLSIPIKQDLVKTEIVKTINSKGVEVVNYVDIIKMTVRIQDLDSDQSIDIESFGRGLDNGDKGFGKAATYARKYALLNAYKIATGEDPDKDKSKDQEPVSENETKNKVVNYMLQNASFTTQTLTHFNIGSIDDLSKQQIGVIFNNLKKKGLVA